jgi:hypothetical protein
MDPRAASVMAEKEKMVADKSNISEHKMEVPVHV